MKLHPGHRDLKGSRLGPEKDACTNLQSLGLARRGVVPLDDTLHAEDLLHGGGDQISTEIHRHREGLEGRHRSKAVNDDPRQSVALAPEDAADPGIDPERITELLSTLEPSGEELGVEILTAA